MSAVVVIDGVTGAGKSRVLRRMRKRLPPASTVIEEDDTLGDLMDDVRDPEWRANPQFPALETSVERIELAVRADPGRPVVVERLHLTTFALFPHWTHYDGYDERLRKVGAAAVLLTFPEHLAEARSIDRPDREAWGSGMAEWYGSRAKAVQAVVESQRLRREALRRTRLPYVEIDTRDEEWDRYAATVPAYARLAGR